MTYESFSLLEFEYEAEPGVVNKGRRTAFIWRESEITRDTPKWFSAFTVSRDHAPLEIIDFDDFKKDLDGHIQPYILKTERCSREVTNCMEKLTTESRSIF